MLPAISNPATSSAAFPAFVSPAGDGGGWMYLNPAGWVPVCPPNSRPEICQPGVPPYIGKN
ncbi:MAG TPA: hypothetical protein VJ276_01085 [Thermoanaerobaculia bacterium]|nr:hypothetical protein [Thermoanaerobaculia bacterium]